MNKEMLDKIINAQKNLIVEGDVFSGKTSKIMFPIVENIISKNESFLALDSKEEFLKRYYDKLKLKGYNIVIVNFDNLDNSEGWNPLEYPYRLFKNGNTDRAQDYIELLGNSLFKEKDATDPFWSQSSADLFTGVTLGLFEDAKEDEVNLNSVASMIDSFTIRSTGIDVGTRYFNSKNPYSTSYMYASSIVKAPNETKGSIISVAKQKIRLCASRTKLSTLLNKTTFDYDALVNKPTAIFVISREGSSSINVFAAMFIEQIYEILIDSNKNNKYNLILDNIDNVDNLNELVSILRSCISNNIRTFIATRSLDLLVKKYGTYIPVVCDLITIGPKQTKIVINHVEENYDTENSYIDFVNSNVVYPTLENREIKLFDLQKYLVDSLVERIGNNLEPPKPPKTPAFEINDLIAKIDKKIAELEEKSELDQFKI